MHILIGNAIALVACCIMVISGYMKSKQRTLYWQTVQIGLCVFSCAVLGAWGGMISNILAVPRNIMVYKEKLSTLWKVVFVILNIVVTLPFNNAGLLGLLPVASAVPYTLLMDRLKPAAFKGLIVYTSIVWCIYDFSMMNYVSAMFDFGCIITSIIAIIRITKENNALQREIG